ncbi:MAG: hypothetical protein RIA69_20635 [Cyclobacteriaceae bacterium]
MLEKRFERLSFVERARHVRFNGEFITSIRYYAYKINLYLLGKMYIEVFFHHLHDRVEKIEILDKNSKRIKFYTDQIKLKDLT